MRAVVVKRSGNPHHGQGELEMVIVEIELVFWTFTLGFWALTGVVVPKLFKPRQFGRIFGLTERTVREWIATRKIEVIKVGASVRIPASEADRLIQEGRKPALLGRTKREPASERAAIGLGGSDQSLG